MYTSSIQLSIVIFTVQVSVPCVPRQSGNKVFATIFHANSCASLFCNRQWWRSLSIFQRPLLLQHLGSITQDDDVAAEARLVGSLMHEEKRAMKLTEASQDATLLVHNLTKRYPGSTVHAVNDISFRVGRGECLGLLGVNGAGKTTTFKMLTGDEMVTAGDAKIGTLSLTHQKRKVRLKLLPCRENDHELK